MKQESTILLKQFQEKFASKEKENEELKTSVEALQEELKKCNQVKDNVVNNLGQVTVETKQLIEQGN